MSDVYAGREEVHETTLWQGKHGHVGCVESKGRGQLGECEVLFAAWHWLWLPTTLEDKLKFLRPYLR